MNNSISLLRKLFVLLTVLIVLVVFLIIFQFTDIAFRVWDRLQHTSPVFLIFYLVVVLLIAAIGAGLIWKIWTIGRNRKNALPSAPEKKRHSLETLQARAAAARAQGMDVSAIEAELEGLGVEPQELDLAFFGKISTGKSSLIQTLLPNASLDISIIGGSTTAIERYHYENAQGLSLTLLDMPGTHQAGADDNLDHEVMKAARRVHIVAYVIDQDITESDMGAIRRLYDFEKPMLVILNKSNLYNHTELEALQARIRSRLPDDITFITCASAYPQTVRRIMPDGSAVWEERYAGGDVTALLQCLAEMTAERGTLTARNRDALLSLADENLSHHLTMYRRERGEAMVKGYARKAMLGGVAAVGPGTDVLIQGYLGMDMLKALTKLYDVPARDIDLQTLVDAAGSRVKSHLTVILALAGNVCKAFPGIGTVIGGASHAVAYGLIFESLGRATLQALESSSKEAFSTQNIMQNFEEQLHHDLEKRAQGLVRFALGGREKKQ
ncbi:MAG: 50S ribosome-binding GTPase [Cardiobacteriaceae bacterium]|nr:50S ribosome-binding GTPase [Cardiobacteriaceae bacterium]